MVHKYNSSINYDWVLWNKKWDGKCPDRIQRQVLKNSHELGGLKATDMAALNSALKVKQFINATKLKK